MADVFTRILHSDGSVEKRPMHEIGESGKWETDEEYVVQGGDTIHIVITADGAESWIPMWGLPPLSEIL